MNQHVAITAAASAPKFSSDDFYKMMEVGAFEDMRVELVRGELVKMAPSGVGHGMANAAVTVRLASVLTDADSRVGIDIAVDIADGTIRAPDIIVLRERWTGERRVQAGGVELVIEISDTTLGKDLDEKSLDYACGSVPVYWVVDVKTRSVHVFTEPQDGRYTQRELVGFDDELSVPGSEQKIRLA